jgi:hypothetical protein
MTVSLIRVSQLHKPDTFDDTLSASTIAGVESAGIDAQDISDALISQVKRIIYGDDSGNWYDDPATKSLTALAARPDMAAKLVVFWRLNLTDVGVGSGENWALLASSNQPPNRNIAIAGTAKGAVTAKLSGAIGSNSLTEIAGSNALKPKNLVAIFDGATGDALLSANRRIWGLLQVGSAATDGNAFGLTGNDEGQISFVRPNATFDDLEACPVGDIQGKTVIYAFSNRNDLSSHVEDEFRGDLVDVDPGANVSLDNAYDGGATMDADGSDVDIRLSDTVSFIIRKASGDPMVQVTRTDAGSADVVTIGSNVDTLDINAAATDFAEGIAVDSGGQTINVGKTAVGVIDSTSIETRATTGDNTVSSVDGDVLFQTAQETTPIPLDDATTGPISTIGGGSYASVAAAIAAAMAAGGVTLTTKVFVAGSAYAQGANIPAATLSLSDYTLDTESPAVPSLLLFLNGRLLHGGNGTTKNDIYAGTTPASGDAKVDFPKGIKSGDVLISVGWV